jgi:hypothetical protein
LHCRTIFDAPPPAPTKPQVSVPLLLALTVLISAITFVARLWWIEPTFPRIVPKGLAALPFAAIVAFGLALVICLAVANRHRWRAVLHPNRGRIIGAAVLAFLTPFVVFSWVPWIIGGAVVFLGSVVLSNDPQRYSLALYGLAMLVAATAFWYPVACLIISGFRSWKMRVAVFALMFWTAYSASILTLGTMIFRL